MDFVVEHKENGGVVLRFEPRFTASSGTSWPVLGWAALGRIKIEDWRWVSRDHTLNQYIDGVMSQSDYANMVGAAQADVTKIMDRIEDWLICKKIFEDASKCKE